MIAEKHRDGIKLPGLATAHSHAFQRGLRGLTQRRQSTEGSFWGWRDGMYQLAARLDPESMYSLARFAYAELARAGVTAVGEFHYVHHQADGTPYEQRTILAEAVIQAARDVGIRISLLRVLYHRGGFNQPAEGAQRRFCDPDVDRALADVADLVKKYPGDGMVQIGIAAHSVRAVPRVWVTLAHQAAVRMNLPFHMHVAEQRREVDECIGEFGMPPVRMLAEAGVVDERFVAVHATHLADDEIAALGAARSFVCMCRTTERDLGDGLCRTADLVAAGARLCTGVDSHAISDPFEEARAIELDDRSRTESRHAVADATDLLRAATSEGYDAIGLAGYCEQDRVILDAGDPSLVPGRDTHLDDAVVYGAAPRAVKNVDVGARSLIRDGSISDYEQIRRDYQAALQQLLS